MKKTLLIMVMALAVLLTQCRKPEVKFPSPVAPEGTTVSMTVTAGPGSKTDITTMGGITWSTGDKLYVGDGTHYVGYLTIVSGQNTPTGTFSGDVMLPTGTTDEKTFHFFYLGSGDYTSLTKGISTSVDVDFSSQEIYAEDGNLKNASKHHVGYGSASGTVKDGVVTGINVTLVSKVALARFSFKKGDAAYDGALTLSGTNIYKEMTVNFGGTFTGKTKGTISLTGSHSERYVMLVPVGTESETLCFAGEGFAGSTTLGSGIEPNKFYGREVAIEVKPVFTVNKSNGTKVTFAPGNLYYDGTAGKWKFESNQWDFRTYNDGTKEGGSCIGGDYNASSGTPANDWGLFGWSTGAANNNWGMHTKKITTTGYTDGDFKDWGGITDLPDNAGGKTWRTLSNDEWKNLLGIDGAASPRENAASLRAWVTLTDVSVSGLVILPDGSPTDLASTVTTTALVASSGAVFLPAAGNRYGTGVSNVGSYGYYWSSTPNGSNNAYYIYFLSGYVLTNYNDRYNGLAVRLVR